MLCRTDGSLGRIRLQRPRQLNALTLEMTRSIASQMDSWLSDPTVGAVVIEGAGERAFCAGGDVRAVCALREQVPLEENLAFFREEYALNLAIHRYPKPYVAVMDGITMGGGVGLSVYGSHRIATERTVWAMPETGIGFFPDVGGTWFLPRLPGATGAYLALTGRPLVGADLVDLGLATHFIRSGDLPALAKALSDAVDPADPAPGLAAALEAFARPPGPGRLVPFRDRIERCFGFETVEEIRREVARLAGKGDPWAGGVGEELDRKSPTACKVTLAALARGRAESLAEALDRELVMTARFLVSQDFCEGVRAALVDRDRAPRWQPAGLDEVDDEVVYQYFLPFP